MTTFLFDVDGTLTDARRTIDPEFEQFMMDFVNSHHCMIVTGSDRPKTLEQIGEQLTNSFARVYHCSGNHVFENGVEVDRTDWALSQEQIDFLNEELRRINYSEPTGNHIEQRVGTANVSIVGRNADWDQRGRYAQWEEIHKARHMIALAYNEMFDDSVAQVAGETSIDIFKVGCDKKQAIDQQKDTTIFFGDNCFPGGNDHTAAQASTVYHQIDRGYKQTWQILKKRYI